MTTHSRILAWKISWAQELGGLQSMGSKESGTTERLTLTIYPKCIGFPETSLNKGKRKIQSKLSHDSCLKPRQLTVDNYRQACGYTPVSIIECMILFGYTYNQGILLGDGEPWGSSFLGPGFPVGQSFDRYWAYSSKSQSSPRWSPAFKIEPVVFPLSVSS